MEISDQSTEDSRPESANEILEATTEQDVAVRARIAFHYRDNRYYKGEELPVNDVQGKKLVAQKLAYYDSGNGIMDNELTIEAIQFQENCGCG